MKTLVVLSMLHESAGENSATRIACGRPVLAWTLARLARVRGLNPADTRILCRADQESAAATLGTRAVATPGAIVPAIAVARTWCPGWRGGLMLSCEFDLGYDPAAMLRLVEETSAEAVLLVNPASMLVDPSLLEQLLDRATTESRHDLFFVHGAPGCGGAILRNTLVKRLAGASAHPGVLLCYQPQHPTRDPIGSERCVPSPMQVCRTTRSLKADSASQVAGLERALVGTRPEFADITQVVCHLEADSTPILREMTIELTTHRATRPTWHPSTQLQLDRSDADPARFSSLWQELAGSETRITLAGVGDPVQHTQFANIVREIVRAGLPLHVETDLVDVSAAAMETLAGGGVHVISIVLPAGSPETYTKVMGVDKMAQVGENLARLLALRNERKSLVPIIVPTFYKLRENIGEMEGWYDHWLNTLGSAVIRSPDDCCGRLTSAAVVDMSPPRRSPCRRLHHRMAVSCDGQLLACDAEVTGSLALARLGETSVRDVFRRGLAPLREMHESMSLAASSPCAQCKQWYRP